MVMDAAANELCSSEEGCFHIGRQSLNVVFSTNQVKFCTDDFCILLLVNYKIKTLLSSKKTFFHENLKMHLLVF